MISSLSASVNELIGYSVIEDFSITPRNGLSTETVDDISAQYYNHNIHLFCTCKNNGSVYPKKRLLYELDSRYHNNWHFNFAVWGAVNVNGYAYRVVSGVVNNNFIYIDNVEYSDIKQFVVAVTIFANPV